VLDVTLNPSSSQGSYALYSARIGVESPDQGWRLTVWGNNLGDEEYGTYAEADFRGTQMFQGMPRTYGATVDWNF
jgi:iron complex outermembrane recepter protein